MNRNLILIITILIFLVGCNSSFQEKPNILFIMSDDHAYQAISAYDDRLIETPNIDRISDEGMLFTNASVTNSICAPSRAVILTGKHSHINGKIDNISKFDDTQMTFPQLFQKAGYQTALFGKLHFGNNPKGIDDFLILPGQGDYINPKFLGKDRDTIITGYVTDVITDLTLDWFKNKRDKNIPFLTFYLHKAPHRAWWPSPEKFAEFYEKKFPEPETLYDDYSNRGSAAKSAEMNLLTHMQYMQDSKVRPSVFEKMKNVEPQKIKKDQSKNMNLSLEKNEDILKHVSDNNPDLKIVGFAAETENMIDNARKKLSSKNLNLIVANDVSDSSIGFDSNNNEVTLITEKEELKIPKTSKEKVARKIVQFISKNILND